MAPNSDVTYFFARTKMLSSIFAALFMVSLLQLSSGTLVVDFIDGAPTNGTYVSVPLIVGNSPSKFAPVSGYIVMDTLLDRFLAQNQFNSTNSSIPSLIVALKHPGSGRPYFELKLKYWVETYRPAAIVIFGEDVKPRGGDLGRLYVLKQFFNTSVVTVPVLNARLDFWTKYESCLANGTNIQVTLSDGPDENPWIALRASWWWPFWITISIVWALTNSALCIFLISRLTRERSLALVVLSLELTSNLMRLPFFLDPFGGWWLPVPLINVFYSMHWPIHIASSVIVVFFWIELVSSNDMTATGGFLTSSRWPAALSICIIVALEFSISAARAVTSLTPEALLVSAVAYLIILAILTFTYFYVYAQVRKFLAGLAHLRTNDKLIQRVSIRFLFTSFSFIVLIVMGILTSTPIYDRAVGQSLVHAFIHWTIDSGSTFTIAAFYGSIMAKHKSRKSRKSRGSSQPTGSGRALNP